MKYNIMYRNSDGAGFMREKRPWTSQVNPMLDPCIEYDAEKVDAEVERLQQEAQEKGNPWGECYFKKPARR